MDSKVKSAVGELESLFSTKAKGTTVYFNDFNYTPIPQPITEAVKIIMSEYPELKYRIGLYSVTVLDTDKKKITNGLNKKPIESMTSMGKLHDDFVQAKINESELKDILVKEKGYGKRKVNELIDKWKPEIIKSSISDYFNVTGIDADKLEDIVKRYDSKSDIRTALEDYFHIYDDYAEMSVEEFDNALDEYFQEMGDGLYEPEETDVDEEEFYKTNYEVDDDLPMDSYDGDDYSESLE